MFGGGGGVGFTGISFAGFSVSIGMHGGLRVFPWGGGAGHFLEVPGVGEFLLLRVIPTRTAEATWVV